VGKSLSDPALAEFTKHAKARWNVEVRTSALSAGTPLAYGRILEWNGRPQADLFWGGESALFDRLASQGLLAQKRYEQVNATFRREIESVAEALKRKY